MAQQGQLTETCPKQNAEIKLGLGILKFIYENYNFQSLVSKYAEFKEVLVVNVTIKYTFFKVTLCKF